MIYHQKKKQNVSYIILITEKILDVLNLRKKNESR